MTDSMAQPVSGLGKRLFTMAVVADTHMNEAEGRCSSPFEVNRLANARTRYVVELIKRLEPSVVVHLGDLVHPVPSLSSYAEAAASFHSLTGSIEAPLHLVAGNHDVGDKPIAWGPAGIVREDWLAKWEAHFGAHYYAVEHDGLELVILNAQILNSGLPAEAQQREWLESHLATAPGKRRFICLHYPPYLTHRAENESYDNIGEPGRAWLLALIERYRPEALFAGHVHNFWYYRHAGTDCYVAPSTAFVRQDYSEFYRIEPGPEGGRNDAAKLGFFCVDVHERGHVCRLERTYGRTLDPGETLAPAPQRVAAPHPWTRRHRAIGMDLRQPWAEVLEVTASGAVDEFERKKVRNDYPLLSLWEMGIRDVRVPIQDLADPGIRARMRQLAHRGHRFTVYTFNVPGEALRDVLTANADIVHAWEVVTAWQDWDATLAGVAEVKAGAAIATRLAKLRSKADLQQEGHYYHAIAHGFTVDETKLMQDALEAPGARAQIDGFVIRCARDACPIETVAATSDLAHDLGVTAAVHVRQIGINPGEVHDDEFANAARAVTGAFAAAGASVVEVFLDTLADVDRGYFRRAGLVDRRYNPRAGWHALRHLHGALDAISEPLTLGSSRDAGEVRVHTLLSASGALALVLPRAKAALDSVPLDDPIAADGGHYDRIDLATGIIASGQWTRASDRSHATLDGPLSMDGPTLLRFSFG